MKIYLDTIGCRLNQSEIETYARQFRAAGHELVETPAEADTTVINTYGYRMLENDEDTLV